MGLDRFKFTQKEIDQIEALAAVLTLEQIADYFGISVSALNNWRRKCPEIDIAYKKGKANAIYKVANGVLSNALSGDKASSFFYLKTQAGWSETNRTEITTAGGKPLQAHLLNINLSEKSTDELLALKQSLTILQNIINTSKTKENENDYQ